MIAAPFLNLVAYGVIWYTSGWEYSLITLVTWLIVLWLQHLASKRMKTLKMSESKHNDERQKLVNDMVVGARTLKSYGWENHYIDKINAVRNSQLYYVFHQRIVGSLGFSFFNNGGLIALI